DPQLGAGRRVIGDRGVVETGGPSIAPAGDINGGAVRADGYLESAVKAACRAVIAADPQLGAGGRVVGDRGVVRRGGSSRRDAGAGDIYYAPGRAHRHRGSRAGAAGAAVAAGPQLGAGGRVVSDRGVLTSAVRPSALSGDVHRRPVRADRHRPGV